MKHLFFLLFLLIISSCSKEQSDVNYIPQFGFKLIKNNNLITIIDRFINSIDFNEISKFIELSPSDLSQFDKSNVRLISGFDNNSSGFLVKLNTSINNEDMFITFVEEKGTFISPILFTIAEDKDVKFYSITKSKALFATVTGQTMDFEDIDFSRTQVTLRCGQDTMDCIGDAYTNHGWIFVWISVQSAFLPQTAAGIAGACALKNCL